jgi:hypothetical protein
LTETAFPLEELVAEAKAKKAWERAMFVRVADIEKAQGLSHGSGSTDDALRALGIEPKMLSVKGGLGRHVTRDEARRLIEHLNR